MTEKTPRHFWRAGMTEKTLVILGAGGYGQTVADVAEQLGYRVQFLDDAAEQAVGKCDEFLAFEKTLVILGAGGYGQTVADVAEQLGYRVQFLDDAAEQAVGKCDEFLAFIGENREFYPAFGNNALRLSWLNRLEAAGCALPVLVQPRAYVSPKATLAPGTVEFYPAFGNNALRLSWLNRLEAAGCALPVLVQPRAYVSPKATLAPGTVVLPGAIVNTLWCTPGPMSAPRPLWPRGRWFCRGPLSTRSAWSRKAASSTAMPLWIMAAPWRKGSMSAWGPSSRRRTTCPPA